MWDKEVAARGLSLLLVGRDKRGEAGARGGVHAGLRWAGMAVEVSGIGLVSGDFLLDESEAGDAVERIGLHFEPGVGDLLTAAGTDSV